MTARQANPKPRETPTEDKILRLLKSSGPMTRPAIEKALGQQVPSALIRLVAKGGVTVHGRPRVYSLYTEPPPGFGRFSSVWAYANGVKV